MSQPDDARVEASGPRSAPVTVFVSDPTAEAERVAQAMRAGGYTVVDVPLSMLIARVAVQHPRVILIDADGEGALDVIARMRELPDAEDNHVLLLALPGGAVGSQEEALAHEASGLFVRPVDVPELVQRVGARSPAASLPRDPRRTTAHWSLRPPMHHDVARARLRPPRQRAPALQSCGRREAIRSTRCRGGGSTHPLRPKRLCRVGRRLWRPLSASSCGSSSPKLSGVSA